MMCCTIDCTNDVDTDVSENLCRRCWNDEQRCLRGECACCWDEQPEYPTADVVYDMRGGATSDYEWYGGYMDQY